MKFRQEGEEGQGLLEEETGEIHATNDHIITSEGDESPYKEGIPTSSRLQNSKADYEKGRNAADPSGST